MSSFSIDEVYKKNYLLQIVMIRYTHIKAIRSLDTPQDTILNFYVYIFM